MNTLENDLYTKAFSHLYVEEGLIDHPRTIKIKSCFPNAVTIPIKHYKDVFCRSRQNITMQKKTPMLILAKKEHNLIYEGAPVCQNFGHQNFYYTSCMMNCIYNCEYCYLQGMYPSGNIVIFINLEDIFQELEEKLKYTDIYLCISYDTDLLAMEALTGYVSEWVQFASMHKNLTIEIRTKSANYKSIAHLAPVSNVIFAWTLSPSIVADKYEHLAPAFPQRLLAAQKAAESGWPIRLCFDPMIFTENWKNIYHDMIMQIFAKIPADKISDTSVGVFRVSKAYLKKMRKQNPESSILYYPYELENGVYEYNKELTEEMVSFLIQELEKQISSEKIFCLESQKLKEE